MSKMKAAVIEDYIYDHHGMMVVHDAGHELRRINSTPNLYHTIPFYVQCLRSVHNNVGTSILPVHSVLNKIIYFCTRCIVSNITIIIITYKRRYYLLVRVEVCRSWYPFAKKYYTYIYVCIWEQQ